MGTHWKKLTNPDYLGAYAFDPKEEKVVTIREVREETVTGADGKRENCTIAHFQEQNVKPMILNATNCKMITRLFNSPYIEEWAGKVIVLHVQKVHAFGEVVDAVRIKPERPNLICTQCKQAIQEANGRTAAEVFALTRTKYKRALCASCAAATKAGKVIASAPHAPGGTANS